MPDLPNPESRVEQYLANLTDGTTEIPKEPESRIEQLITVRLQQLQQVWLL